MTEPPYDLEAADAADDDAHEPFPQPRQGHGRWRKVLLAALVVGLLVAGAGGVWVMGKIDPAGSPGAALGVEVPRGASTTAIGALLVHRGVITNAQVFRVYVRLNGAGPWQAGTYRFRRRSSMADVVRVLDRGPEIAFVRLTIPEGYTLQQIARRVGSLRGRSAARFLALAQGGTIRSVYQPAGSANLEGLLYPDTYTLDDKDDEAGILRRMVGAFDQKMVELGVPERAKALGVTPYQLAIVASMIEREARVPEERPKVARVVYNRLGKGMRLGIDATTRYELDKPTAPLRKSELERDSPYNTRTRPGLPPTPISSPGEASLRAAANPEAGTWLYYVIADDQGRHAFVTTDAEFQRAKADARAKGLL